MANFDLKKLFGIKRQKTEKEIAQENAIKGDIKKEVIELDTILEGLSASIESLNNTVADHEQRLTAIEDNE